MSNLDIRMPAVIFPVFLNLLDLLFGQFLFLTTSAENMYLSSSIVKQIAVFGGDISSFVPAEILPVIESRLRRQPAPSEVDAETRARLLQQVQQFANSIGKDEDK